jgi:hypothetical protein
MKWVSSDHIDKKKWDERIRRSSTENIFCYSWYLDAVAASWGAYIDGDYESIVPIPYIQKLGVKQLYQPAFTRELDIFGNTFNWQMILNKLSEDFKGISFRNRSSELPMEYEERKHQLINLQEEIKYRTNAKRLIKKAQHFLYESGNSPKKLINLFKGTAWSKIDSISESDLNNLENLMNSALERNQGELLEVYDNGVLIGAGFFLIDKKRITYLKGASTDEGKKAGAMFGLMNQVIVKYQKAGFETFDFGGSDVENVANFYKKFGAVDRTYYNYKLDNLPKWFKALKKLKG